MADLAELTELGMAVARVQGRRALAAAEAEETAGPEVALAFARVSSVVRQSIALEARLSAGLIVAEAADEESPQAVWARMIEGAAERLRARLLAVEAEEELEGLEGLEDEDGDERGLRGFFG